MSTVFISAGHHLADSGAVSNGEQENLLAIDFRNLVLPAVRRLCPNVVSDTDTETLKQYLDRIQTTSNSVVLEFHFDSAASSATGTTCLVGNDADRLDKAFANDLAAVTAQVLQIPNRGVKSESESHRGRLGLMREKGIVALLEICFISNKTDIEKYKQNKKTLATAIATVVKKYEVMAKSL